MRFGSRAPAPSGAKPAVASGAASRSQHRLLALAAVCQAVQLAHLLAQHGETRVQQQCGDALLAILHLGCWPRLGSEHGAPPAQPPSTREVLVWRLGLQTLERLLWPAAAGPRVSVQARRDLQRNVLTVLRLSSGVNRRRMRLDQLQQTVVQRLDFFDQQVQQPAVLAGLADLYAEATQGRRLRVLLRGQASHMSTPVQADRLRACLWAGLHAAHLWRQHGGTLAQLLWQRRLLQQQLQALAQQHFYTDSLLH